MFHLTAATGSRSGSALVSAPSGRLEPMPKVSILKGQVWFARHCSPCSRLGSGWGSHAAQFSWRTLRFGTHSNKHSSSSTKPMQSWLKANTAHHQTDSVQTATSSTTEASADGGPVRRLHQTVFSSSAVLGSLPGQINSRLILYWCIHTIKR